ncbi:MAG: SpoIIE family protein phosphatase [Anaerolineae bacterium]|nr:SpoIIE family protein phosphatase [Anaerolineae bacterium]
MDHPTTHAPPIDLDALPADLAHQGLSEIQAFLHWLAAEGQADAVSRTALVKYRAHLVEDLGLERDVARERLTPVKRFVAWYDEAHPNRLPLGPTSAIDRRVAELHTLKSVAETLNQSVDVGEAIDAVLAEVSALLSVSTGWVFLLDDADNFIPVDAIGLPPALAEDDWRELRRGPECECQWQLHTGQLKRAVNIVKCSRLEEASGDTRGLRYHASIPIRARKRVLGILNLTGPSQEIFRGADLQVLEAIGDQLGMAIERARLLEIARSRRIREQEVLLRISHGLLSSLDPAQVTELVVTEAANVLGADAAAFSLFQADDRLTLLATVGWSQDWLGQQDWRLLPGGLTQRVLTSREPILEPDLSETLAAQSAVVQAHGWQSALAVPVELRGEIIGVLTVNSKAAYHFSEDDKRLLGLIAAQAAMAVRNAREYEEKAEEAWHRNALLQVSENIRNLQSIEEVLETVGRIAPLFLGASHCGFYLWSSTLQGFVPRLFVSTVDMPEAQRDHFYSMSTTQPGLGFDRLLAERNPYMIEAAQASEGDRELLDIFGADRVLLVPLVAHGLLVGAMALDPSLDSDRFTPRLLEIASGIATQTAVAIENERLREAEIEAQRMAQELELARHIQRSFLPDDAPNAPGWDICPRWEPARTVTGDFYDFVPQEDGRLGIVIADVSDKGAPAAIFMAVSRSLLRASIMANASPVNAITQANRLIAADAESSMFVTAFHLALDGDGCIHFVNAGHNPPLLVRASGETEWLAQDVHGPVLGVLPDVVWSQQAATLAPGDTLVLYTDGVTEAINKDMAAFGEERLVETVRAFHTGPVRELTAHIVEAVNAFAAGQPQFDDITLVVLKRIKD